MPNFEPVLTAIVGHFQTDPAKERCRLFAQKDRQVEGWFNSPFRNGPVGESESECRASRKKTQAKPELCRGFLTQTRRYSGRS